MILLSLSIIGLILSVILVYYNARVYPSSAFLGTFFFLVSFYAFGQWVMYYSKSPALVGFFFMNFAFLAYLIGPFLYWYIRSTIKDNYLLKKKDYLHLLPAIIFFVTSVPYMLRPWSYKLGIAYAIINDIHYVSTFEPTILYKVFPVHLVYLSFDILIFCYLVWSVFILIKYLLLGRKRAVIFSQGYMIRWQVVFLVFMFILALSHLILMSMAARWKDADLVYATNIFQVIAGIGLVGLLISPLFFPEVLYGLPRIPNHYQDKGNKEKSNSDLVPKKPITPLESEYIKKMGQKVERCMMEHQAYLQKDLNLTELSVMIHIPVHHLAFYFREERGQSFTNYRNRWRIDYAKTLINDGKAKDLTLEAIGMLSGFTNRNSFIIAFKRFEGVSPHQYVSHVQAIAD